MKSQYTQSYHNRKNVGQHRKVWIINFGEIPEGYIIHHINLDKKDNRIENLQCVSVLEHNRIHFLGKPSWNKGLTTPKSSIDKQQKTKSKTYIPECIKTFFMYYNGINQSEIATQLGISRRQVCERLQKYRILFPNHFEILGIQKKK